MRNVFSAKEVLEIDSRSETQYGITPIVLMEHAARSCMDLFLKYCKQEPANILILAGGGNNGGDAYALARMLINTGHRVSIVSILEAKSELCVAELNTCKAIGIRIISTKNPAVVLSHIRQAEWIIDGICGVGVSSPLRENLHIYIDAVNTSRSKVFSIDVPSGLYDGYKPKDVAIRADYTASIELSKYMCYYAHTRLLCGTILNAKAGFPPMLHTSPAQSSMYLAEDSDITSIMPVPQADSYKNSRGVLSIYAGKVGMAGAAILATQSALAMSTGKVRLFCDEEIAHLAYTIPAALVQAVDSGEAATMAPTQALLVGCGWGREGREVLLEQILTSKYPLVLDADALNIIAGNPLLQEKLCSRTTPTVLTPHPGEAALLLKTSPESVLSDTYAAIRELRERFSAVVVLKSHVPLIADKEKLVIVDGINPALATAGSGDVLAGIIAALCAQGVPAFPAAWGACLIHQYAGRQLSKVGKVGSSALTTILPQLLSKFYH